MDPLLSLAAYAERWLALAPRLVHPRTAANYARSFRLHLLPVIGAECLAELRRTDVRAALLALFRAGKSRSTVRSALIALSACLSGAVDEGFLQENPAHGAGRRLFPRIPGQGQSRSMTREQLAVFLEAAHIVMPALGDFFVTLAMTGVRVGEGLGLQPADVDRERRVLRIARSWTARTLSAPKGGRVRSVDLARPIAGLLSARIRLRPGRVWLFQNDRLPDARPWDSRYVETGMRRVIHAAGLPRFTPHAFRHTYAALLLEETGDVVYVQRMLGHSSVAITADLYGLGAEPHRHAALDRLYAGLRHPPLPASLPLPPAVLLRPRH